MNSQALSRLVTVVVVFALYSSTMCRWIGAGDTAIVVWNMDQMILSSHVNNHAAMVGIGWAMLEWIPWGEPAWKANWFSVIFATATLGMFHVVASRAIKDPFHTFLACLVVAVTHTVWWHATIVENYALNGVVTLVVVWMLQRDHESGSIRWLYGASLVAGLGVLNHAQMGFLAPMLGGYAAVRRPVNYSWPPSGANLWNNVKIVVPRWGILAAGWFAGLIPFLSLIYRNISRGLDEKAVVKNAVGSHFTEIMFDLRLAEIGTVFWREVIVQFPSPVLLLLPFGVWFSLRPSSERRAVHFGLLCGFAVNSGFFMLYHTWDRFAFLLPSYLILLVWLTEAWGWAVDAARERRPAMERVIIAVALISVVMPPMVYRELPRLGRAGWFWHGRFSSNGQWNTHDIATYLANPDKSGWNDLDRLNRLLLEKLPQRAVVIDDDGRNHYTLNLYFQNVLKQRRDIRATLVNAWGFENWGQDKSALAQKIVNWRRKSQVFAMTQMPPHRAWQNDLADRGIGPVPWYLDEDLWIFAFEDRPRGAEEPFFWEVHTGLRLRGQAPAMTWQVGPEDQAQVRVRYRKTTKAHTATLRWTGPEGESIDQPMAMEAESERTVVDVPPAVLAAPGRWKVDVVYEGEADTYLFLMVRDSAVDRRFR